MAKLKKHHQWWETNIGTDLRGIRIPGPEEWGRYMANSQHADRKLMRARIDKSCKTLLDVGCGACEELKGLKEDGFDDMKYTGVDVTPKLVDYWKAQGVNIVQADCEELPFEDSSFEVTTARHIIEHMPTFEKPLEEWIRVTKNKILICFFNGPIGSDGFNTDSFGNWIDRDERFVTATDDIISYDPNDFDCYSNWYHKGKIEKFLENHSKVQSFEFLPTAPTSTSMLEIILENSNEN
jgi:ubiquinone/menaquinone biosynthesis C-methylase UbiE